MSVEWRKGELNPISPIFVWAYRDHLSIYKEVIEIKNKETANSRKTGGKKNGSGKRTDPNRK